MQNTPSYPVLFLFAWRNIWRYPKRTILLLSIIFLGFFCALFFSTLMQAWGQSMLNQTLNNLGAEIVITGKTKQMKNTDEDAEKLINQGFYLSDTQQKQLNRLPVFQAPRIVLPAIIKSEYELAPTQLVGVNLQDELALSLIGRYYVHQQNLPFVNDHYQGFNSPFSNAQTPSLETTTLSNNTGQVEDHLTAQKPVYEVIVGAALLQQLNTQVGRRIVVMTEDENGQLKELGLRVVGRFSMGNTEAEKAQIYLPIYTVQKWLNWKNILNQIAIKEQRLNANYLPVKRQLSPLYLQPVLQKIQAVFPNQKIQTWQQKQPFTVASIEMMLSFNWIWVLLIGALMLFGLMNSLYMILYERRAEFMMLFSLGMAQTQLRFLLLIEIFGLLFMANLLAIIVMTFFVYSQKSGIDLSAFSEGSAWLGVERILYFQVDYSLWLTTSSQLFMGLLLASLLAVFVATRIKKLRPNSTFHL